MTDQLPDPLVPAEVDLSDFPFMPVDTDRLIKSETWVLGTGDERAAAFTLWAQSWHQIPAGSLPDSDRMLDHLSQSKRWKQVKAHALRSWVRCSDGRLYHPVVCEKALEAWIEKLAAAISGATGNAKRWQVDIDTQAMRRQFVDAVERLRRLDPTSRALKKKVVAVITAASQAESGGDQQGESGGDSDTTSPPDRNRQGQGQGQGQGIEKKEARALPAEGKPDPASDPLSNSHPPAEPTPAGLVCKAMRQAGLMAANPSDPRFVELLRQGATQDEFVGVAQEAVAKGKGWAWILVVVEKRRAEAAALHLAPPVPATPTSQAADRTADYLREQFKPFTPEEKAKADEARKRVMAAVGITTKGSP
jgi:hypothetical protein